MSACKQRPWLVISILALAGLALGYETNGVKWPGAVAHLRLDARGFPLGSAESQTLIGAMDDWNRVSASEFVFTATSGLRTRSSETSRREARP